jgi:hypothetical protein
MPFGVDLPPLYTYTFVALAGRGNTTGLGQ